MVENALSVTTLRLCSNVRFLFHILNVAYSVSGADTKSSAQEMARKKPNDWTDDARVGLHSLGQVGKRNEARPYLRELLCK